MFEGVSRRGFLGATAALGGSALLSACGGSGSSGGGGASGEIMYNTSLDPSNTKDPRAVAQTAAIAAFEKANPKIKVRVNVDPAGANVGKAIAARADQPDVWRATNFALPQFVKQRGIASLDKYIERDGLDREDWLLPLSLNQFDGETFSLQQDYRIPVFLYRADAYKAAGISTPPATFEDVIRVAGDISGNGKMGFPVGLGAGGGFFPGQAFLEFLGAPILAERSGGKLFAPDGREPAFDKAAVQDLATLVNDLYAHSASTKTALNWGYTETHQALQTGSANSATFGLYRFTTLKTSGAADLAWAPAPTFDAASKQAVYGQTISINNNSRKKDAAWEFIKFMTNADTQATLARGGEVVSRKSAYTNSYFKQPEAKNVVAWRDLVQKRGEAVSYSINYPAFGEVVSNAMTAMVLQNGSPQAAADEIMKNYADKIRG
ncbi:extracellular solute-binding protein [Arthrobacter sp. NPDC056727]|uniref:extracellular solute-binding protein n=1 Tax=Arthrobacter sp. NPDC056727 TaxID=3345927 RepID=UPI00366BBDE9